MKSLIKIANQQAASNQQGTTDNPAARVMRARAKKIKAKSDKIKSTNENRPEGREYKVVPPQ